VALGADVQTTACRRGQRGGDAFECAFYNECHYQAMLRECANADVVFAAHELLFKLPAAIGEFGLVIIDEAFWEKGLFGEDVKHPIRLNIADLVDELNDYPVNKRVDGPSGRKISVKDEERTAELRALLERLQKALTGKPVGYIRREYLVAVGLDDNFRRARILEWARKVDLDVRPGDDIDGYKAAAAQHGEFAGSIKRRVDMWRALENFMRGDEEATGWLSIQNDDTKQGRVKQLEIMGCRPIDPKLRRLPIIHADATLQLELSRYYLPRLKMAIDLKIASPFAWTTQVIGMSVGITSLQPLPAGKRTALEEKRVATKRKRVVGTTRKLIAGRRGLVIAQLAIEDDFKGLNNVEVAHFGAINGIDRWGVGIDVLVIIGRSLPWKTTLARYAAAITGKPVLTDTVREKRIVGGLKTSSWTCTDPDAEMIRVAITEAGVEQAHGRIRAVRRTAANPVEIYMILGDTVAPGVRVDGGVRFQAIEPGPVEKMRDRGWTLTSPKDAHELFPDLFPTPGAAEQAYHRGVTKKALPLTSLYKYLFIKRRKRERGKRDTENPVVRLSYRRQGSRYASSGAVDPIKVPDPRAALEAAFGEKLVFFDVLTAKRRPSLTAAERKRKQRERQRHGQVTGPGVG